MTDPKPRSSFLPILLIVVCLVIVAGVVLAFVPLVECEGCIGIGAITTRDQTEEVAEDGSDISASREVFWTCEVCSGKGSVTMLRSLKKFPPLLSFERLHFERIKKNRQATP